MRAPSTAGSRSRIVSVPSEIGETQATIRMVLVLPAPLGPRKPKLSPGATSKSMASTAVNEPNRLVRPRAWMSEAGAPASGVVIGSRCYPAAGSRGAWGTSSPAWAMWSNCRHSTTTSTADPTKPNQNGAVIAVLAGEQPADRRADHHPAHDGQPVDARRPGRAARRAPHAGGRRLRSCPTRTRAPRTRRTSRAPRPPMSSAPAPGGWRSRSGGRRA